MFWRKQKPELFSVFDRIVIESRDVALKRLGGEVPPALFAFFWALSARLIDRRAKLFKVRINEFGVYAENSFVTEGMRGFGSMGPDQIADAKNFYKTIYAEVGALADLVFDSKVKPMDALRAFAKGQSTSATLLNDPKIGPIALICSISIFAGTVTSP